MSKWLKILLTILAGFSAGGWAASQVPSADATAILVAGGATAAASISALLVQSPIKPKPE